MHCDLKVSQLIKLCLSSALLTPLNPSIKHKPIADSLEIYFKGSVCSYCLGICCCLNPIWTVRFRLGSGPVSAVNLFKRFYGIIWWFNEPECSQFIFMRSVNHLVLGCWTCGSLAKYLYYECWISERTFNYNALAMLQSVTNNWKVIVNQLITYECSVCFDTWHFVETHRTRPRAVKNNAVFLNPHREHCCCAYLSKDMKVVTLIIR